LHPLALVIGSGILRIKAHLVRSGRNHQSISSVNYWEQNVFCLPCSDQKTIIISDHENDVLLKAGHGQKDVEFCNTNISAEELKKFAI
jgi:hypothetical protein